MSRFSYARSPNELRPNLAPYLVQPRTADLTEAQASQQTEQIKRQQRGVRVAIAQAELDKDRLVLQGKRIEVGIAAIHLEGTKEDFYTAGFSLIGKRATTATAQDNAAFAVTSWSYNQDTIRQKIQGLHIQVQEATQKNLDKSDDLKLRGVIPQFSSRF